MGQISKRVKQINALVDRTKTYELKTALDLVKKTATAKFDESIDVAVNLGIDAKKSGRARTRRRRATPERTSSASTTSPRRSRPASWSSTW